ncbi:hypothetical protein [Leeia oryzae]|uniref:hypothetical protein n=1 Tax=Leeia oryzae TaxID=356662 RepID=UPI0012EA5CED|nr:hypothetical protein [Leeia oryzae]
MNTNQSGALCAWLGVALLFTGTLLHPMSADPNQPIAAFTEYAADHHWVGSHLLQLVGVGCMLVALLALAHHLSVAGGRLLIRTAVAGAITSLALAAALQAVDGIALHRMVHVWADAPVAQKPAWFTATFAVRQIEVGLASLFCITLGITAALFGLAQSRHAGSPRGLGLLAISAGLATAYAGWIMAHQGFSETVMMINMPANLLLMAWMLWSGWQLWTRQVTAEQERG